jgi:hypothetical protein
MLDTAVSLQMGQHTAQVRSANGAEGILCRSAVDGRYFFRMYEEAGSFTDYELRHDDLAVTISLDALASFYQIGDEHILDHSPEVLGLNQ